VKLSRKSSLARVAACVSDALARAGIRAVLTGGACATLYSSGAYESFDLDFVLQSAVPPKRLDEIMRSIGFRRRANQYEHAAARYLVEFPPGPLGLGADIRIRPVPYQVGPIRILVLSATDSCRDRLASFYHWNDRQALAAAIAVARRHRVNLERIGKWSRTEGATAEYREFLGMLGRRGRLTASTSVSSGRGRSK
jgi:hypothetical protein